VGKTIENPRYDTIQARVTEELSGWAYTQANMAGKSVSRWLNDLLERERNDCLPSMR